MAALRRIVLPLLLAPILLVLGCEPSSNPTTVPDGAESVTPLLGGLVDGVLGVLSDVTTLRRTEDVEEGFCARNVRVSPAGGVVECAEAGLLLLFPPGALRETTEISVHIPRGDLVGYEFAPHGLRFETDVALIQDLDGTEADEDSSLLDDLVGAYVEEIDDVVTPLELLAAKLLGGWWRKDPEAVRLEIEHFSGYVCATS